MQVGPQDPTEDPELFLVYARRMSGLTEAELTQVCWWRECKGTSAAGGQVI